MWTKHYRLVYVQTMLASLSRCMDSLDYLRNGSESKYEEDLLVSATVALIDASTALDKERIFLETGEVME